MNEDNARGVRDGGPAFGHGNPTDGGDPGMSLRDYFAGQALVGMIFHHGCLDKRASAADAYEVADAMLAERECK